MLQSWFLALKVFLVLDEMEYEGRAKLKPAAGILVMGVMEQNVMEIPSYLFNGKLEDSAHMVGFWYKQGRQLRTTAV